VTAAQLVPPARAAGRREGLVLLAALLLAAVALRPQLVGAGPLIPAIQGDLGVSHAVAGLVGTIPVLCMGVFAPAAGLFSARWGLRAAMAGCLAVIAVVGIGRAAAPGAAVLLALTLPIGIAMAVGGTLLPVAVKHRAGLIVPWLADRVGSRRGWMWFAAGCLGLTTLGFAALPAAGFAWSVSAGVALGTVFPICLTMCLDVARDPAEVGAAAALMFLAGYPIAALGPLGVGALRDVTGSFDASLWALFGVAVLMAAALAPLTRARLRPQLATGA